MVSEDLEEYYDQLITYWPEKSIIVSDSHLNINFVKV